MSDINEELRALAWPAPLPSTWLAQVADSAEDGKTRYTVKEGEESRGEVLVEKARTSKVAMAYPAGLHDYLLTPSSDAPAEAIQLVSEQVWAGDKQSRRLVLATALEDVPEIARAEAAGYRYIVDVDIPGEELSLLVAEPHWVLEESRNIDIVPTRQG